MAVGNSRLRVVAVAAAMLLAAGPVESALAQDAQNGEAAAEQPQENVDAIHDEFRALRDAVLRAVEAKDIDALLSHLHPDVVLTMMDGKELIVVRKRAGARDYLEKLLTGSGAALKSLEPSLTIDELTILHGNDAGIAFGSSDDRFVMRDGRTVQAPSRWSATLVRSEGGWSIANLQFSYNPFDNPVLDAAVQWTYWIAGGAALLGLLAGFVVMGLRRRSAP